MVDCFTKVKRSQIMKSVKSSRNTSTEQKLINEFKLNNITGWRRNYKLFGKPDFVFPHLKKVVFTDGCFWHGHDCRNTKPKSNKRYWANKIERNKNRDKMVNKILKQKGWDVIRIWECQLRKAKIPISKLFPYNICR